MGLGINNPVPRSLGAESRKAAKILTSFVKPNQFAGPAEVIPPEVLANAKGLAVLTVLKAGFLFSGRAGSGIVVARLPDGTWSGPSGIMTGGAGAGGQIGAELTDFVFILNSRSAVETFAQLGSITLGGNVSVAAGPLGRNAEAAASASVNGAAAVFAYSKTKGLFAGVSLEGSVLIERRDANRKFYGPGVTAKDILIGNVEPPPAADPLLRVLESRAFSRDFDQYGDSLYDDIPSERDYDLNDDDRSTSGRGYDDDYQRGGRRNDNSRRGNSSWKDDEYDREYSRRRRDEEYERRHGGGSGRGGWEDDVYDNDGSNRRRGGGSSGKSSRPFKSTYSDHPEVNRATKPSYNFSSGSGSGYRSGRGSDRNREDRYNSDDDSYNDNKYSSRGASKPSGAGTPSSSSSSRHTARAKYTFEGEQSGDLSFQKGDIIDIITMSNDTETWWTGRIGKKEGIFPANYVQLL